MKALKGNKLTEITQLEFLGLIKKFFRIEIDFGTGDGRFIYKNALSNLTTLYIGIDTNEKQMMKYSREIQRKKLNNALLILGSLELLPKELEGFADTVYIHFPWGSLLKSITQPIKPDLKKLSDLLKNDGVMKIVLGYSKKFEANEINRLNLPELDSNYIKENIIPIFQTIGLKNTELEETQKIELKEIESTWSKKLSFGKTRKIYKLDFIKSDNI